MRWVFSSYLEPTEKGIPLSLWPLRWHFSMYGEEEVSPGILIQCPSLFHFGVTDTGDKALCCLYFSVSVDRPATVPATTPQPPLN